MNPESTPDLNAFDVDAHVIRHADGLLVVNKPWNVPSSGDTLDDPDSLQNKLINWHGAMVWAVHQLDADTTGINVFVTGKKLAKVYQDALTDPASAKRYLAVVRGIPEWKEVTVDQAVGVIAPGQLGIADDGKPAKSVFRVLDSGDDCSLLEARIFSGRTHQIRIHLQHLGHPVLGERWYCDPPCYRHVRQALHAWKLDLAEPTLQLKAPVPQDMVELMQRVGLASDI
jgi:23S rRNA-/tRNA-specific pseudouridylate synthase